MPPATYPSTRKAQFSDRGPNWDTRAIISFGSSAVMLGENSLPTPVSLMQAFTTSGMHSFI